MEASLNNIIFLLCVFCFTQGCTSEDEARTISEYFKNNSGKAINVKTFIGGVPELSDTIRQDELFFICSYTLGIDKPLRSFCHDSVVFIFPNDKGYICGSQDLSLCFSNDKIPLGGSAPGFPNVGGDNFVFTITEEDYLNARDLD